MDVLLYGPTGYRLRAPGPEPQYEVTVNISYWKVTQTRSKETWNNPKKEKHNKDKEMWNN